MDVNTREVYRLAPLHPAPREVQPEVTCILLEQGADSDALDNNSQLGHFEVARVLLKHGTDMNSGDINIWAPLHEAPKDGHSKVVHFLLNHGANVQVLDLCR